MVDRISLNPAVNNRAATGARESEPVTGQRALWNGWHHHMALVMMAMLFMLTERLQMKEQCPLLSSADIEKLLAAFLPRRDAGVEQVFSHMKRRHEMRRRAIESHAKRNTQAQFKVT